MTGRNHHSLGLSAITETSLGYPAHNSFIGFEHGFLPEMLLEHGYNTFAIGKWHLTAPTESTTAGPFNRWPLGRGFERFYGFLAGSTDHWFPDLVYDNHPIPPPTTTRRGTTSTSTSPTMRSSSSRTPTSTRPTSRSCSTTRSVPATRRTT